MSSPRIEVVDGKEFAYTEDSSVRVVSWWCDYTGLIDNPIEPFPTYVEEFDPVISQYVRLK